MVLEPILCPTCGQDDIVKHGRSGEGKQRYKCRHPACACQTFILDPSYRGRRPSVKQTMVDMAMHGSGIRATPITLRTRIKRLTRQTICFSKTILMHDTVIG